MMTDTLTAISECVQSTLVASLADVRAKNGHLDSNFFFEPISNSYPRHRNTDFCRCARFSEPKQ